MMKESIFYILIVLMVSCNKIIDKPLADGLHRDAKSTSQETVEEVEPQKEGDSTFFYIPHGIREPIIDRYIQFTFGRGVNDPNAFGNTPLIEAVGREDEKSTIVLLEHPGINLNATNEYSNTALQRAAMCENVDILKMLLEKGADVNCISHSGWTPLHHAVSHQRELNIILLLENGAAVNIKTIYGDTALYFAIMRENIAIVKTLLDHGADVMDKDYYVSSRIQQVDKKRQIEYMLRAASAR